jgi:hypothetical protein
MNEFERIMRALGRAVAAFKAPPKHQPSREVAIARKVEAKSWTFMGAVAGGIIAAVMFGSVFVPLGGPLGLFGTVPAFVAGFYYGGQIGRVIGWIKTR